MPLKSPEKPLSPFDFDGWHKRSVYAAFPQLSDHDIHGNDASESSVALFKSCAMEIALWSLILSTILMLFWIWKLRRDNRRKETAVLNGLPYSHTPAEKYQDVSTTDSITEQDGSSSNPIFVAHSSFIRSFRQMMIPVKREESVNSPTLGFPEPTIAQPHNAAESPNEKLETGESFV